MKKNKREIDKKKLAIFISIICVLFLMITLGGCLLLSNHFPEQIQSICSKSENIDDFTNNIKNFCNNNGLAYKIDEGEDEGTYDVQIKDGDKISHYTYKSKESENPLDVDESKLSEDELKERNRKKAKVYSDVNFALSNNKIIDTLKTDLEDIKKDSEKEGISFEYEILDKLNNDYVVKSIIGGTIYRNPFKVEKEDANLTVDSSKSIKSDSDKKSTDTTSDKKSTKTTTNTEAKK